MAVEGYRYDRVRQTLMLVRGGQEMKLEKLETYMETAKALGSEVEPYLLEVLEDQRELLREYDEADSMLREAGRAIDKTEEKT